MFEVQCSYYMIPDETKGGTPDLPLPDPLPQIRAPGGGEGGTDFAHAHHCGATIISDDVVLTAAHCFQSVTHP